MIGKLAAHSNVYNYSAFYNTGVKIQFGLIDTNKKTAKI